VAPRSDGRDAIGYAVCHRLESHSLKIGELQMPLCARCTGEFNAAAVTLIFQALVSPKQSRLPIECWTCWRGVPGFCLRWIELLSR
jgi:uncharacterized membrane protein